MNRINMTRVRWSRWRLAAGTLLGVAILSACDGENLFDPEENPFTELHVTLSGASGGVAGDTLRFLVSGDAPTSLSRFDVSVRGAVVKDTSLLATGRQASGTVKLVLPAALLDTLLYVSARAVDQVGNASAMVGDTFIVSAPPVIASLTGGEALAPGGSATLRVRATGLRALSQMTVVTQGAVPLSNYTVSLTPSTDVTRDFPLTIPTAPADTLVQVSVTVKDISGLSSTKSYTLPIQVTGPEITSLQTSPPTATPGSSLIIDVSGAAMRGVAALKVVLSGSLTDTAAVTFPSMPATTSAKLTFPLPSDLTGSTITVDAYAVDRSGVVSAPLTSYVVLATGDPVVDSLQVPSTIPAGGTLDVRAYAHGPRPLSTLTVRIRGGASKTITKTISPSMTSTTTDLFIPIGLGDIVAPVETWSCGPTTCSTTFTVEASVSDQAGLLSTWSTPLTVVVTNLPKPADPSP
jgi:hypothetical protein